MISLPIIIAQWKTPRQCEYRIVKFSETEPPVLEGRNANDALGRESWSKDFSQDWAIFQPYFDSLVKDKP